MFSNPSFLLEGFRVSEADNSVSPSPKRLAKTKVVEEKRKVENTVPGQLFTNHFRFPMKISSGFFFASFVSSSSNCFQPDVFFFSSSQNRTIPPTAIQKTGLSLTLTLTWKPAALTQSLQHLKDRGPCGIHSWVTQKHHETQSARCQSTMTTGLQRRHRRKQKPHENQKDAGVWAAMTSRWQKHHRRWTWLPPKRQRRQHPRTLCLQDLWSRVGERERQKQKLQCQVSCWPHTHARTHTNWDTWFPNQLPSSNCFRTKVSLFFLPILQVVRQSNHDQITAQEKEMLKFQCQVSCLHQTFSISNQWFFWIFMLLQFLPFFSLFFSISNEDFFCVFLLLLFLPLQIVSNRMFSSSSFLPLRTGQFPRQRFRRPACHWPWHWPRSLQRWHSPFNTSNTEGRAESILEPIQLWRGRTSSSVCWWCTQLSLIAQKVPKEVPQKAVSRWFPTVVQKGRWSQEICQEDGTWERRQSQETSLRERGRKWPWERPSTWRRTWPWFRWTSARSGRRRKLQWLCGSAAILPPASRSPHGIPRPLAQWQCLLWRTRIAWRWDTGVAKREQVHQAWPQAPRGWETQCSQSQGHREWLAIRGQRQVAWRRGKAIAVPSFAWPEFPHSCRQRKWCIIFLGWTVWSILLENPRGGDQQKGKGGEGANPDRHSEDQRRKKEDEGTGRDPWKRGWVFISISFSIQRKIAAIVSFEQPFHDFLSNKTHKNKTKQTQHSSKILQKRVWFFFTDPLLRLRLWQICWSPHASPVGTQTRANVIQNSWSVMVFSWTDFGHFLSVFSMIEVLHHLPIVFPFSFCCCELFGVGGVGVAVHRSKTQTQMKLAVFFCAWRHAEFRNKVHWVHAHCKLSTELLLVSKQNTFSLLKRDSHLQKHWLCSSESGNITKFRVCEMRAPLGNPRDPLWLRNVMNRQICFWSLTCSQCHKTQCVWFVEAGPQ